ncbi:NUDIX hydrolase [Agromyces rhizosphaerae]|uniref:NUDIX hydrolase n=1 Tax=Agromyces rhizosphaerae TaxID=88374 RepID=A0A9W6CZP7_9MICO|nr:NUDIX domain-containing protein [Agromyces rhizosphaerae]GLI26828.1 NUDIX hydrolase [Agromyces rhizosphaerae]
MTDHAFARLADDIEATLRTWHPIDPDTAALRERYLAFVVDRGADAVRREGGREHLTASAFVFSPDLRNVLLCFHRKGQFWVQVGGHVEAADATVAAGALREAREESGLHELSPLDPGRPGGRSNGHAPADLHRHELSSRFGHCTAHWDVGYAFTAAADATPTVSDESDDVRWWPVHDLPAQTPHDFPERLAGVLAELAARAART